LSLRGVEHFDDGTHLAVKLGQDKGDKLAFNNGQPRTLERYLKGDLNLCVRRADVSPCHDGIIFQARPNSGKLKAGIGAFGCHDHDAGVHPHIEQAPMFPYDVKLMQGEKKVIPSFVWLETFDCRPMPLGKPVYFFDGPINRVDKILGAFSDGKINVCWRSMAVSLGKRDSQQIKAAPQTMNDEASFDVDEWADGFNVCELEKRLPHFEVLFLNETVRAIISPSPDSIIESWELGFGPVNTCSGV